MPDAVGVVMTTLRRASDVLDRLRLVRVELLDAAGREHLAQPLVERGGKGRVFGGAGGQAPDRRDPGVGRVRPVRRAAGQPVEDGLQGRVVRWIRPSGTPPRRRARRGRRFVRQHAGR